MTRHTLFAVISVLIGLALMSLGAAELWIAPGHPTPGHQPFAKDCFACHKPFGGTPAEQCKSCHAFDRTVPVAANGNIQPGSALLALHRSADGRECVSCHVSHLTRGVTSATRPFDHRALFPLEPPHDAACQTCHTSGNFQQYSCTGCHEHSRAKLAREHAEEGIRNLDDCVRCHRSGREHD